MPEQRKILIAEDDDFLSSLLKNRLTREGFLVELTKSGDTVIALMKSFKPDVVLLDIILPGKLGFEILEEAKGDSKISAIPFIVMSNLGQEEDVAKAKALGAASYFVKARILIDDVVREVAKLIPAGK